MAAKKKPMEKAATAEVRYSKNQLLAAERFRDRRDVLDALLSAEEAYTVSAVEQALERYMKGQVK